MGYSEESGLEGAEYVRVLELIYVLLGAGILVEIPIAMIVLSRVLKHRANRWANIAAGTIMIAVQSASLFVGIPALYYHFFSVIEIATTVLIVWFAWKWREPVAQVELNEPELSASRR
jgi:threonine/homoserine/homoserine lactone efflux protein